MIGSNGKYSRRLARIESVLIPEDVEMRYVSMSAEDWDIFSDESLHPGERQLIADRYGLKPNRYYKIYVGISPDDWDD